ncbi:MAG: hypothetical protein NTU41_11500 [Chloroflexi bacterium]|nr:hypothetical protein [Chloroflexota bacterium]
MRRECVVLALVLVLLIVGAPLGCASSAGTGDFLDLMKKVPVDSSSFAYWAVGQSDADQELWDIYEFFRDSPEAQEIRDIGLSLSTVSEFAKASGFGTLGNGSVAILSGDLARDDVERLLKAEGYSKGAYEEIGIWTPSDSQGFSPVAVFDNLLMLGDEASLKLCIDVVIEKDKESLYKANNVRLVGDKLPDGVLTYIRTADPASDESYVDLVAYGRSYRKADSGVLDMTAIYQFQDSYAAGQAIDSVNGYLANGALNDLQLERGGSFVRATAKTYISDFVASYVFK